MILPFPICPSTITEPSSGDTYYQPISPNQLITEYFTSSQARIIATFGGNDPNDGVVSNAWNFVIPWEKLGCGPAGSVDDMVVPAFLEYSTPGPFDTPGKFYLRLRFFGDGPGQIGLYGGQWYPYMQFDMYYNSAGDGYAWLNASQYRNDAPVWGEAGEANMFSVTHPIWAVIDPDDYEVTASITVSQEPL